MYDEFLCKLDHDDDEHDEHAMNLRVLCFQKYFDLPGRVLHAFGCLSPMHQSRLATSLNETVRFIK